jgi:hypothetical protein
MDIAAQRENMIGRTPGAVPRTVVVNANAKEDRRNRHRPVG